jgi:hypothetical protein
MNELRDFSCSLTKVLFYLSLTRLDPVFGIRPSKFLVLLTLLLLVIDLLNTLFVVRYFSKAVLLLSAGG